MPIPVAVLEQSTLSLRERVLDFLEKNPTQAYTSVEIHGGLQGLNDAAFAVWVLMSLVTKDTQSVAPIVETLKTLEQEGLVRSAKHDGVAYYAVQSK